MDQLTHERAAELTNEIHEYARAGARLAAKLAAEAPGDTMAENIVSCIFGLAGMLLLGDITHTINMSNAIAKVSKQVIEEHNDLNNQLPS